jgi:alpha-beta hydrolase superfamily lysophospholipase
MWHSLTLPPASPNDEALTAQYWDNDTPEATGKGVLVFVPGLAGSMVMAHPFLEAVKPQFRAIVGQDLRSFGLNSHAPTHNPADWHTDLTHLYKTVLARYPNEPVTLAGISLGGVVVSTWLSGQLAKPAIDTAHWPHSLLLLVPAFLPHPKRFPLSYLLTQLARRAVGGVSTVLTLPYNASALSRNPEKAGDDWSRPKQVNVQLMLGIGQLSKKAAKVAPTLHVPTCVVIAGADSVCDPTAMAKFASQLPAGLPHTVLTYPEAYHDILLEPEMPTMATAFTDWLVSVRPANTL